MVYYTAKPTKNIRSQIDASRSAFYRIGLHDETVVSVAALGQMCPWCSSVMRWAMDRPRPKLPSRLRAGSAR